LNLSLCLLRYFFIPSLTGILICGFIPNDIRFTSSIFDDIIILPLSSKLIKCLSKSESIFGDNKIPF